MNSSIWRNSYNPQGPDKIRKYECIYDCKCGCISIRLFRDAIVSFSKRNEIFMFIKQGNKFYLFTIFKCFDFDFFSPKREGDMSPPLPPPDPPSNSYFIQVNRKHNYNTRLSTKFSYIISFFISCLFLLLRSVSCYFVSR